MEFVVKNHEAVSAVAAVPSLPEFERLKLIQNKWSFYDFVTQQKLPVVPSIFVGIAGEVVPAGPPGVDVIEYPALLKPTLEGG